MTPNPRASHPWWDYVCDAVSWWRAIVNDLPVNAWPHAFSRTHHQCLVARGARRLLAAAAAHPEWPPRPEVWNWTDCELAMMREQTVADLLNNGYEQPVVLTCDTCELRHRCEFAMDGYNTDGDCLAEK